jgi:hypothetical protein
MNQPVLDLHEPLTLAPTIDAPRAALPAVQQQHLPSAPVTPGDLLRIAMERDDKDLDRLERLMAMEERYKEAQERDRQREAVLAFRRDFAGFRGENVIVPKTKLVEQKGRDDKAGPKFMQSEFDVVCSMLSPALSKHGFSFRHDMKFGTREWPTPDNANNLIGWVTVTCFLEHRDGSGRKNPLQEMQSTASYLKRQSILAITGTATGGEDDESRMRRRPADSTDATPESDAELSRLVDLGNATAEKGSKAINAWWAGLTGKQRELLHNHFGAMKKAAAKADGGAR